jgi:hypothetical protein
MTSSSSPLQTIFFALPSGSEGKRRRFIFFALPSGSEGKRRRFIFFALQ